MLKPLPCEELDEKALEAAANAVREVMGWGSKGKEGNGHYCAEAAVSTYLREMANRVPVNDA